MATTPYKIGYGAEHDLHNRLLRLDFLVMRAHKSQGPYDLLGVLKGYRPLLMEVKYYKVVNDKVIANLRKKVNTNKLIELARMTDSYPLLVFKLKRLGFMFYRLDTNVYHTIKFKDLRKGIKKVLTLPPKF